MQAKIINKCMLHMMYRKINLVQHLKALKTFYMSGNGDFMEQLVDNLFGSSHLCMVPEVSSDYVNSQLEFSLA